MCWSTGSPSQTGRERGHRVLDHRRQGRRLRVSRRVQADRRLRRVLRSRPPSPRGLRCLDIGASTGGFCDVLLRRGAAQVIALDVGHGQLDSRIARDPRVIEMSGVNIRDVTAANLPYRPDMIVSDVSFISLTYVIPVIARIAAPGASVVLLVKPQFEVGKGNLGKGGIVEDRHLRDQALETVVDCANQHGLDGCGNRPVTDRGHSREHGVPAVRPHG